LVIRRLRWLFTVVGIAASLSPVTAQAAGKADLSLSVSGPTTIEQGVRLVYKVAWANAGPDSATNAKVLVTFPSSALQWDYFDTTCNWQYASYPDSVNCLLGTVPAGASGWFYFDFYPQTLGTYQVSFVMTSAQTNPSPKDSKVAVAVTVVAPYHADLFTNITSNAYSYYAQQTIPFSLSVGNNGPGPASNVVDTVQLSPGLSFVANGSDARCTASGQTVTCAIGSLPVQPGTPQYLAVNASAAAGGTYTATSTITGDQPDQDASNNSASWTVTVQPPQADMAISFPGTYPTELTGRRVPMLVEHDNNGPNDATGVVVQVIFPAGWTPDPADSDPSCNSTSGTTLICNVGFQAANTQAQLIASGIPASAGTYTVTGTINSDLTDPYASNNSASTTVPVVDPMADLSVVVDGPSQSSVGQQATYTINITNNGPQTAASVTAVDSWTSDIKKGILVVNAFTSNGMSCTVSASTSTVSCPLGDMPYGAFRQAVIVLEPLSRGTLVDNGQASSPTFDPNTANNSGSVTTTVQ
jgi:uncharacterized repeat protein (TIGR01451 family)